MKRRRKDRGGMEGLASLLPKVYPSRQPEQFHAQRLFAAWGRVVSSRVLKNARPVFYRRGILTVHTATSAWANALSLESDALKEKLRARVPGCGLGVLRFRSGPLPTDWPAPTARRAVQPPLRPLTQLPENVARELARIHDDSLRDTIARAASLSLAGEKRRQER